MIRDLGHFDLIVVGAGVNGAGIARDAAGRGLSVLLCEKADLAQGTSSRSGKLVHGGLRYLEYYEFRLVREALIEREVLLRMAPHIIRPMRFVLPHSPEQRPAWMVRAGLFLYDHLGGRRILPPTRSLDLSKGPEGESLRKSFKRAFEYSDCWVDDARLVALNAVDVRRRNGLVLTRTALLSARRAGKEWRAELRSEGDGRIFQAAGKILVNAAGPWVEDVLHLTGRNAESRVRLVKGSHIVTPKFWNGDQAYLLQNSDKRVIFVNPYEGDLALIGTTDIPFEGRAEDARIDRDEIHYLLSAVGRYFTRAPKVGDIVQSFSGVRPLFDDKAANPSAVTRDYVFDVEAPAKQAPMLSVFGGKITTYRKLAEHALEKLSPYLPRMARPWTESAPLPGGNIPNGDFSLFYSELRRRRPWLPEGVALGYARRYGARVDEMLDGARSIGDLGRFFGGTLYEREARFLAREEWAASADDVLERRTKHVLHLTEKQRGDFAAWFETLTSLAVQ